MARAKSSGGDASFGKLPVLGKIGILVALLALIGAAYYFALHSSVVGSIESAGRQRLQLQRQMSQAQEQNSEYVRLREEVASREQLDQVNLEALPADAEMPSFLRELNREAEASGLTMALVEPRPEEPEERYVRLPVRLRLTGTYHQLARFFHAVSSLNRLISMDDLRLANPRGEPDEPVRLDVEVQATTYRRPLPEELEEQAEGEAGS